MRPSFKRKLLFAGLIGLAGALAACQQRTAPAPDETAASAPETEQSLDAALAPVSTLEGAWRVAGIDGEPFDEPYGLALTADADRIWWEPTCAGHIRDYQIEGSQVSFSSASPPPKSDSPQAPAPVICTIGLPDRLRDVMAALDAAQTIGRTAENGVLISGGGRSLTLFSQ